MYRAENRTTGKLVALKKIKLEHEDEGIPCTAIREISLLKQVALHANVVNLYDVIHQEKHLTLVFEYLDEDLRKFLDFRKRRNLFMSTQMLKSFVYQILSGLAFCHSRRVLHRDLKPQNLLVEQQRVVKLADFGLAREFTLPLHTFTHEVVTLWYRAPEILLGTERYTSAVDIWSVGCIMAEMATNTALFQGDSEIELLLKMFSTLGTPSEETWSGVSGLKHYKPTFPRWTGNLLRSKVSTDRLDDAGLDLLSKMLTYDPEKRITARQAMEHPWFRDVTVAYTM